MPEIEVNSIDQSGKNIRVRLPDAPMAGFQPAPMDWLEQFSKSFAKNDLALLVKIEAHPEIFWRFERSGAEIILIQTDAGFRLLAWDDLYKLRRGANTSEAAYERVPKKLPTFRVTRQLTSDRWGDRMLRWSPDGSRIVYDHWTSVHWSDSKIWVMDRDETGWGAGVKPGANRGLRCGHPRMPITNVAMARVHGHTRASLVRPCTTPAASTKAGTGRGQHHPASRRIGPNGKSL